MDDPGEEGKGRTSELGGERYLLVLGGMDAPEQHCCIAVEHNVSVNNRSAKFYTFTGTNGCFIK